MMETECDSRDEERLAWLILKLTPDLGNRSILRLVRYFGSPSAVLKASARELASVPRLRQTALLGLQARKTIRPAVEEWERLRTRGIELLCLDEPSYPMNLGAIPDPPAVLFVQGALEARDLVSVAVVGSRAASAMGMAFTERLCRDLAQNGVTVVSGLAVGIDAAAHRGALEGGGRTVAVLGCGLDVDYPRSNATLRRGIAQSGAVVSEFPLGTAPAPGHFPQRNRIISGLSLGVVVVEAGERSGSLITARLALEQGREVFAVPGTARHYRSVGPHRLIREGARLVESAEDVLEEIQPLIRPSWEPAPKAERLPPPRDVTADEALLLDELDAIPRHVDEICRSVQKPVGQVMALLLSLELKGVVRQLPGKYFIFDPNRAD